MNLPCQTIEDLLPLYHDGVCSQESRQLVEAHLEGCESCKKLLAALGAPETGPLDVDDSLPLKSIQNEWNLKLSKSFQKGIAITLAVLALLLCVVISLNQNFLVDVPAERIEITQIYRLSHGPLLFHFYVNDSKDLRSMEQTITEDGALYLTPKRAVLERDRRSNMGLFSQYFVLDIDDDGHYYDDTITSLYFGPVGDGVLVWEKDMKISPASEELEARFPPGVSAATP